MGGRWGLSLPKIFDTLSKGRRNIGKLNGLIKKKPRISAGLTSLNPFRIMKYQFTVFFRRYQTEEKVEIDAIR